MGSTSAFRGLVLPSVAGDQGTWGTELNQTIASLDSILGRSVTFLSSVYGTNFTPASSQAQASRLVCVSTGSGPFTLNLKSSLYGLGTYNISNQTQGTLTVVAASSGTTTSVVSSAATFVFSDGVNVSPTIFAPAAPSQLIYLGFLTGLTLSTASPSSIFGVSKGQAADSLVTDLMTLPSNYTKAGASLWSVGSGGGSLDAGAMTPGAWYYVFLIKRPDTGVVDVLTSLSPFAPTLPANYTIFRRIGAMNAVAGPVWRSFIQVDDEFYWGPPICDYNGGNISGTTLIGLTLTTPPGISTKATIIAAWLNPTAAGSVVYLWGFGTGGDPRSASGAFALNSVVAAASAFTSGQFELWTTAGTPAQIFAVSNGNSAAAILYIVTYAYRDRRGRDGSA